MSPAASVVITTYNQPRLLDLTLHAYARQSTRDFELLIADDGSGPETRELIERHRRSFPVRLEQVWQPDEGFLKSKAVNRAVLTSRGDYLVFSDGDCIPSRGFVEEHLAARRPGTYIVGGHIRLSPEYTRDLTAEEVLAGSVDRAGTRRQRLELWSVHLRSLAYIALRKRRKPKFYGLNFSVDRESFVRVNGFDQTYRDCGREDSDLRNRMQIAGIRACSLWHRARVFHLHHASHGARGLGRRIAEYYNRPDLRSEAPVGLRELEIEIGSEQRGDQDGGAAAGQRYPTGSTST